MTEPAATQPKSSRTIQRRGPEKLSTEYHKARKEVMLWAGILFIWELVGIDLEIAKETGGNAGAIIKSIKSPQAVPWVLLVLVLYFLFKMWIEWNQCDEERRKSKHSQIDFGSAWAAAFVAVTLYAYQATLEMQIADAIQGSHTTISLVFGALIAGIFFEFGWEWKFRKALPPLAGFFVLLIACVPAAMALLKKGFLMLVPFLLGAFVGAAIGVILYIANRRISRQKSTTAH